MTLGPASPNGRATTEDGADSFETDAYMNREPLLDAHGAAELLSVKVSWVRQETRAERMPFIPLGRYRRYDRAALLDWADRRARGPRPTGKRPVSGGRKPQQ
jgi:hypothetical protein